MARAPSAGRSSSVPGKPTPKPYLLDLDYKGFIEGLTHFSSPSGSDSAQSVPLVHSFTGIPYALPPIGPYRFRRPRPLPPCYKYGTRANPGRFTGGAALCPQPPYRKKQPDESLWDEDCLQLNVWIPARTAPWSGWPVLFNIHGGWLQFGTANSANPTALLSKLEDGGAGLDCIVVSVAYRLNAFGFLCGRAFSEESAKIDKQGGFGNFGLWDQRLALEWTYKNISYFGGDASAITLLGHSAGAYSVFHQLSYDLWRPEGKNIIKRAIMVSNGPGMQPKPLAAAEAQCDELLTALGIPPNLSGPEKLTRLRSLKPRAIIDANERINITEFRAVTDGVFVRHDLFQSIDNGEYARRLKERGVQLLLGEVPDEHNVYATWRYPTVDGIAALQKRLAADYPATVVKALAQQHFFPSAQRDTDLPGRVGCGAVSSWYEAFGRAYADLQVHAMERGFVDALVRGGAGGNVRRYRIEWRAACTDAAFPKEWGVTHGTDLQGVWFFGNQVGGGLTGKEKKLVLSFAAPMWRWVEGKGWDGMKAGNEKTARRLKADGEVDQWEDSDWRRGLEVWTTVREVQRREEEKAATKL